MFPKYLMSYDLQLFTLNLYFFGFFKQDSEKILEF